jgi:hypothetical protein
MQLCKYRIVDLRTEVVWSHHGLPANKISELEAFLRNQNLTLTDRGDDIFCIVAAIP